MTSNQIKKQMETVRTFNTLMKKDLTEAELKFMLDHELHTEKRESVVDRIAQALSNIEKRKIYKKIMGRLK